MPSNPAITVQKAVQAALVVAFLGGIAFTSYRTYLHLIEDIRAGQRFDVKRLRRFDASQFRSWKHLPDDFEPAFQDRVEGRDLAVRRFARFKLNWLGVSSNPKVVLGRNGWLYYHFEAEPTYYPPAHPKIEEIRNEWIRAMVDWRQWLKARKIELLIVIAPNKQSIYPEFLPPLEQKRRDEPPLDRLLQEWRKTDAGLRVLDLRPNLRTAKESRQVFFKTDTHWNTDGMVVGYRETIKALGLFPLPDSAFLTETGHEKDDGDLARLLGYWGENAETYTFWKLINPTAHEVAVEAGGDETARLDYLDTKAWERPGGGYRVVFFHDSFAAGFFTELLAEHFGRILAVPSNHMDPAIIERERPNVVILEIVERQFQGIGARGPLDPPRRSMVR